MKDFGRKFRKVEHAIFVDEHPNSINRQFVVIYGHFFPHCSRHQSAEYANSDLYPHSLSTLAFDLWLGKMLWRYYAINISDPKYYTTVLGFQSQAQKHRWRDGHVHRVSQINSKVHWFVAQSSFLRTEIWMEELSFGFWLSAVLLIQVPDLSRYEVFSVLSALMFVPVSWTCSCSHSSLLLGYLQISELLPDSGLLNHNQGRPYTSNSCFKLYNFIIL